MITGAKVRWIGPSELRYGPAPGREPPVRVTWETGTVEHADEHGAFVRFDGAHNFPNPHGGWYDAASFWERWALS